jgi:RNA polymerase sigma factor (sigma-70 family)
MAPSGFGAVLRRLGQRDFGQPTEGVPDGQLLERFVAGRDADAFTALVQRHGPMVFGACRRMLARTQDAEDAFQATFLVLARKAASIRRGESVAGFLHGVARRVARKLVVEAARRARRERQRPVVPLTEDADSVTWGELRSVLDEELGRLSSSLRAPLVLCYLEGQTQDEAARRLGWSKSTLRRRLERGRRLLRDRLAGRGVTLSAGLLGPLLSGPTPLPGARTAAVVQAALAFGSDPLSGTGILARPTLLAKEVLRSMALLRIKAVAGAALLLSALAAVGLGVYHAAAKAPLAQGTEAAAAGGNPAEAKRAPAPGPAVDAFGDPLPADALARLGTARLRHGATAFALDVSPDGRAVASAGLDGGVHVWEVPTGKELLWIPNEPAPEGLGVVLGLAYAPDGKTLAGARMNQPPCLWDAATGKEIRTFGGNEGRAGWVTFSPDGKTLAYGGAPSDPTVRLVEAATGREQHRFGGLNGPVGRGAFSADGRTLAVADEAIHLFDLATGGGRDVSRLGEGKGDFGCLAFSPDGKTLATVSQAGKAVQLINVATLKTSRTIALPGKREPAHGLVFLPDGQTLISGHEDGSVRFWDVASGARTRQFRAHSCTVVRLALSQDGRTLATSCNDHVNGDHAVRLWETATGSPLARHPGPEGGIAYVVFSPDGRRVATASWEGAVRLWEAATGKLLRRWEVFGPLAFTADGKTLLCGGWGNGKVHFLDVATGAETRPLQAHAKGVWDLCLSADGKRLATAGMDGLVRLWDPATGRQLQDFGGKQKADALHLVLSPDGARLVTSHFDHAVRVWETTGGTLVRQHAEADDLGGLALSADGRFLAWSGGDGPGQPSIRVRDLATGKGFRQVPGYGDPLDRIAFAPDGRSLIWGGQHRPELCLFEVATGQLRRKFLGHHGHVTCVAFSPDGRLMASGGSDACVLIWDAAGRRQPPSPVPLGTAALDRLWADLAANDAATAYRAMGTLRRSPRQAVHLLEQHLKPVPPADTGQVARALHDLDSDEFTVRDRAVKELERLGEAAEPGLRQTLAGKPSAEVRRRAQEFLDQIDASAQGRRARALEVLEQMDTAEARRLLTALAHGAPGARLTREARAALARSGRGSE